MEKFLPKPLKLRTGEFYRKIDVLEAIHEYHKQTMLPKDPDHAHGHQPIKAADEGMGVAELLFNAGMEWQRTENLLRELTLRCQLILPTSEEELKWFEEGVDVAKSGDFMQRLFTRLGIGQEQIPNSPSNNRCKQAALCDVSSDLGYCSACGGKISSNIANYRQALSREAPRW